MPKLKINVFGEGIEIKRLYLDTDILEKWRHMAVKRKRPLSELILDPFFYPGLKHPKIKSLHDIEFSLRSGMLNTSKGLIELWFKRHKVLKIPSHELFNDLLLFPSFQFKVEECPPIKTYTSGLYVFEKTIGLLRSEKLDIASDQLDIDDFVFTMDRHEDDVFVSEIKYQNQNPKFIKSDAMVTYQTAFEIL